MYAHLHSTCVCLLPIELEKCVSFSSSYKHTYTIDHCFYLAFFSKTLWTSPSLSCIYNRALHAEISWILRSLFSEFHLTAYINASCIDVWAHLKQRIKGRKGGRERERECLLQTLFNLWIALNYSPLSPCVCILFPAEAVLHPWIVLSRWIWM